LPVRIRDQLIVDLRTSCFPTSCFPRVPVRDHGRDPVHRISDHTSSAAQGSSNIVGQNTLYQTLLAYWVGGWTVAALAVMVVVRPVCFLVVVPGRGIGS
jgi:hypothetical protein